MAWIYCPAEYSRTGKTKTRNPTLQCSRCGARYSEHWLTYIGNEMTGDGKPPRHCPHCGVSHKLTSVFGGGVVICKE